MSFQDDIELQPQVLRDCINTIDSSDIPLKINELIKKKGINSFVFTGMGSSLFASHLAVRYLRSKGLHAIAIEATELKLLTNKLFTDKTLVVAVSQSGESTEVIELVDNLPIKENLVVITNYTGSKLFKKSNLVFKVCAGTEYFTSTKTYTNTLAVVIYLSCLLSGASIDELTAVKEIMLSSAKEMEILLKEKTLAENIAKFIKDIKFLLCVGSGYSYSTACHSEIVLEEAGKIYSSRYTPSQFIHGPIELIGEGFGIILFDSDPAAHEKCSEVCKAVLSYGGKVVYITNNNEVKPEKDLFVCPIHHNDPFTAPLVEIIPVEMAINSLALAQGLEPGKLFRVIKRIADN